MSIGLLIIVGVVLIALLVGLFTLLTNPAEIDAEEERSVEKEEKRRWWHR
ncbi:MAG: hypothetical protein V4474_04100 [Patescibacteria group bacterium]